jgi:hypothetical protein
MVEPNENSAIYSKYSKFFTITTSLQKQSPKRGRPKKHISFPIISCFNTDKEKLSFKAP